ncbi:hypothetical protein CTAYLR_002051 [Chrysophaeum taylorii]|uniref:Thioredoxin domain-containing protein n=1 Tax=Chrysophaeum taylorii TaxID=2483200 RepID=A0AAD7UNZ3_9STRA|nr:hypothetical protein CTAYLR_002051 [Chrysophaeum taylorii]
MQFCCGGVCLPATALWPLLVFALKYLWDTLAKPLRRVLGLESKLIEEEVLGEEADVPYVSSTDDWAARLEAANKSGRPLIVDYGASWCGPCKRVGPYFGQLAGKYQGLADFVKVDIDALAVLATEAKVSSVPTFQVYENSTRVDQLAGSEKTALRRFVESHVQSKKTN